MGKSVWPRMDAAALSERRKAFDLSTRNSFDVGLDDGRDKARFHLNRSFYGLYIPRMIWRELDNFSSESVCLVLASEYYDESDYFRDYNAYLAALEAKK